MCLHITYTSKCALRLYMKKSLIRAENNLFCKDPSCNLTFSLSCCLYPVEEVLMWSIDSQMSSIWQVLSLAQYGLVFLYFYFLVDSPKCFIFCVTFWDFIWKDSEEEESALQASRQICVWHYRSIVSKDWISFLCVYIYVSQTC